MRFIYCIICSLFFFLISTISSGQHCGTNVDMAWLQANAPARYQQFMNVENFTTSYINAQNSSSSRLVNSNGEIIIPVVVHVLHQGESIGSGLNISDAQVQSQIDVLNEDFQRLNVDKVNTPTYFATAAVDYGIK